MSKILHLMTTFTNRGKKIQRAVKHSPEFDPTTGDDESPSGRIPPGGFLTG